MARAKRPPVRRVAHQRPRRRPRVLAFIGFAVAGSGLAVILLHSLDAAFTGHAWFTVGQVTIVAGALLALAQLWGGSRRTRR